MTTKKQCDDLKSRIGDLRAKLRAAEDVYAEHCRQWWLDCLGLTRRETVVNNAQGERFLFDCFASMSHPEGHKPAIKVFRSKKSGGFGNHQITLYGGWGIEVTKL